jgi:hypothetical protein
MKRIQRKRSRGWKMPVNSVYVGRPSKWGNWYDWREYGRDQAVSMFESDISEADRQIIRFELRGKNLVCWCRLDQACHADVLMKIANED